MGKKSSKGSQGIRCKCIKVCFTKHGASMALVNAKIARSLRGYQKRKETRIYGDCPCGHWHLTSKGETSGTGEELPQG
jgi:hypothetical protein